MLIRWWRASWVVDVSYELGQTWAMNRPLAGVTVLEDPADATVGPVRLGVPTPFFVPAGEVVISAPTATPAGDRGCAHALADAYPGRHGDARPNRRSDVDTRTADPAPASAADADCDDAYPRGQADRGTAGGGHSARAGAGPPDGNAGGAGR